MENKIPEIKSSWLTRKELITLEFYCHGYSAKEICAHFKISKRALAERRNRLMRKLQVNEFTLVILSAIKHKIITI